MSKGVKKYERGNKQIGYYMCPLLKTIKKSNSMGSEQNNSFKISATWEPGMWRFQFW